MTKFELHPADYIVAKDCNGHYRRLILVSYPGPESLYPYSELYLAVDVKTKEVGFIPVKNVVGYLLNRRDHEKFS